MNPAFKKFQSTRYEVANLSTIDFIDGSGPSGPGYVYSFEGEECYLLILPNGTYDDTINVPTSNLEEAEKGLFRELFGEEV